MRTPRPHASATTTQPVPVTAACCPATTPATTDNLSARRQFAALTALVRSLAHLAAADLLAGPGDNALPLAPSDPSQENTR